MTPSPDPPSILSLSVAAVSTTLTRAGGKPITEEMIREDIAAGAPENPDGTINLLHYAAWLVREVARGA